MLWWVLKIKFRRMFTPTTMRTNNSLANQQRISLNLLQSNELSLFTDEETVAQRHEVICQSHISSVRVGHRPWISDLHTLLPPLGVRGHFSLLGFQTALFQSGPDERVCSNSTERVFHHAGHIPFKVEEEGSREKKFPSSGLAIFWLGHCTCSLEKFHL